MQAATVFVIDDDADVRRGLCRLLHSAGLDVVLHESAESFIASGPHEGNGCILLDINLPEMTGPELHERLRHSAIGLPVIYLTGQARVSDGVRAMKNGAHDFLEKPVDADALLSAISQAVSAHRTQQLQHDRQQEVSQRHGSLSPREREVLDHVVAGRLNKQIASDMGIAEKTVKVHRGRGMAKMRCRSVADLVRLWSALGNAGPR